MKKILATNEVAGASDRLYRSVRKVIQEAQGVVSRVANWAMVEANWRVGFLIVEDEQKGKRKAEYGKAELRDLACRLTAEYGSGMMKATCATCACSTSLSRFVTHCVTN